MVHLQIHGSTALSARANQSGSAVWLTIEVKILSPYTGGDERSEVTMFFDDMATARTYVDAINAAHKSLTAEAKAAA